MIGKIFITVGILFIVIGILFSMGVELSWLGNLPGDIYIKKDNLHIYFPITTSLLISLVLSIIIWGISYL